MTTEGLRRGISRWWYIVFLSSLALEPGARDCRRTNPSHHTTEASRAFEKLAPWAHLRRAHASTSAESASS